VDWQPQPLQIPLPKDSGATGSWLIFSEGKLGEQLSARLVEQGQRCVVIAQGDGFCAAEEAGDVLPDRDAYALRAGGTIERFILNPQEPGDFRHLLTAALREGQPACKGIVYLWSAQSSDDDADIPALAEAISVGALHLVQALNGSGITPPLWLVTRGSQAINGSEPVQVAQAPVWGLGRTMLMESSELPCVCVDLMPDTLSPGSEVQNDIQNL
jgi:hypothetical protein